MNEALAGGAAAGSATGRWRVLAPAKVNLGLFIGGGRADGRHELVSVMQSISLADELIVEQAAALTARDQVICDCDQLAAGENLVDRALAAYRRRFAYAGAPLRVQLRKRVPLAAGLGGGSGDAAAILRLLRQLDQAPRTPAAAAQLVALAAELGADVPAQLQPGRWLARGAGELLEPLPEPVQECGLLVLTSRASLATAAVYRRFDQIGAARSAVELQWLAEQLAAALGSGAALPPAALLANDLERPARSLCPEIGAALELAGEAGAERAMLSGSGPTVLGIFSGLGALDRARDAAADLSGALGDAARRGADGRLAAVIGVTAASFAGASLAAVRPAG